LKTKALNIVDWISFGISGCGLLLMLADVGFSNNPGFEQHLQWLIPVIGALATLLLTARSFIAHSAQKGRRVFRLLEALLIAYLLIAQLFFIYDSPESWFPSIAFMGHKFAIYWGCTFLFATEFSRRTVSVYSLSKNPANLFIFSFFVIILLGTWLLILPNATNGGISIVDALFTSTSAVCVTGLAVVDTGTHFTLFGQVVILVLIQVGGIGILTFTSFFGLFFRGGFSLQNQLFIKDVTNADKLAEVADIIKTIIGFTLLIEAVGAFIIFGQLDKAIIPSFFDRAFFSVFHSVSSFCNAGFSTLGSGLYDPNFRFNYPLHLTIAFLLIFGGLGFPIVFDFVLFLKHWILRKIGLFARRHAAPQAPKRITMHTKIVLIMTTILVVSGTVLFLVFEYDNSLSEHGPLGKIVTSFFSAVTPRTAGFNTVDFGALRIHTIMIVLLLMWIGASPGSTGGGIKTTTIFIATLNFISLARGKDRVEFNKREISNKTVRRTFAIISLSLIFIGMSTFLVSMLDPHLPFVSVAFECFSAYSTVGLSMGITSSLGVASKLVIICIMFVGRVGALTLLVGMLRTVVTLKYRYPKEELFIN